VRPVITSGRARGRRATGSAGTSTRTSFGFCASATPMFRTWSSREPSRYTVMPLQCSSYAKRYAFLTSSTVASRGMLIVFDTAASQ